jgi:hypothetical protein
MSTSPLVIPVGWTQGMIQVLIQDDILDEPVEDILISLDSVVNGTLGSATTHQITIQDNDDPPQVYFSSAGKSVTEYYGTVSVAVELNKPSLSDVTIPLSLSGTANLTSDYTISTTSLLIPAGVLTGTFQISVVDDTAFDPDEKVVVTLGSPTHADLGTPKTYTLLIEDDELPPCEVGSHLLTVGPDAISLSMVNEGLDVQFMGGTINWVDAGGNKPYLTSVAFTGTEIFTGSEKPTSFSYSAVVDFASLDTQVITYQFADLLGAGTHSLISYFQNPVDGTTCSLTETFTIH